MSRFFAWISFFFIAANVAFCAPSRAQEAAAQAPTVASLSRELICPCPDCGGKALDQCESTCRLGQQRRDALAAQLRLGKSHDQVIQFMSATYGPQILGTPPSAGWGILWLAMPLICLAAGALPLLWFTRGRNVPSAKTTQRGRAAARQPASAAPAAEDARVAEALRDYDF